MTNMNVVSSEELPVSVPPLTKGWRMQMALDHGGRSVGYMAMRCGVSRTTVSRWLHDEGRPPRRGDLDLWARECRVPVKWLAPDDDDEPMIDTPTQPYLVAKLAASTDNPARTDPRRGHLTAVR